MELYRLDYSVQFSSGTNPLGVAYRRRSNSKLKPAVFRHWVAQLDNELKATDVARRFVSALGSPSHLQERGNRNRNIGHREIATYERLSLEGTRTKDANAAVA